MAKTRVTTPSGFEADIDEAAISDYRLLKLVRESKTDATAVVDIVSLLLGEDEERFMAALADDAGRVDIARVNDELTAIFDQLKSKKK